MKKLYLLGMFSYVLLLAGSVAASSTYDDGSPELSKRSFGKNCQKCHKDNRK